LTFLTSRFKGRTIVLLFSSKERKVPLAKLSFQGNVMYCTSTKRERRLNNQPSILYWNDHMSALRHPHIPLYYNMELMIANENKISSRPSNG